MCVCVYTYMYVYIYVCIILLNSTSEKSLRKELANQTEERHAWGSFGSAISNGVLKTSHIYGTQEQSQGQGQGQWPSFCVSLQVCNGFLHL